MVDTHLGASFRISPRGRYGIWTMHEIIKIASQSQEPFADDRDNQIRVFWRPVLSDPKVPQRFFFFFFFSCVGLKAASSALTLKHVQLKLP